MALEPIEHRDDQGRSVVVRHAPDRHRYELVDPGPVDDGPVGSGRDEDDPRDRVIGHTDYREVSADGAVTHGTITHRDFLHTEVDDAYGGRGLASVLVRFALDDVRADGLRIVPHCPYVAGWIRKHEGAFDDLVDWPA